MTYDEAKTRKAYDRDQIKVLVVVFLLVFGSVALMGTAISLSVYYSNQEKEPPVTSQSHDHHPL